ncbi:hypothetical protein PFISCL1PPCAC_15304, partial [Pristionchus fissidentatus]
FLKRLHLNTQSIYFCLSPFSILKSVFVIAQCVNFNWPPRGICCFPIGTGDHSNERRIQYNDQFSWMFFLESSKQWRKQFRRILKMQNWTHSYSLRCG